MNSYLFYDIESSGLNKAFDQVLQFAAVRTDMELNELERYNIIIQLRPDVVIAPMALITHRIPIEKTFDGLCEFDAMRTIHNLLNEPGTISLGYNTLGFDDEFLRFSFYRNLLTPYTHQYANGCSRMDLLPIAALFRLYKPEVLNWPDIDGKPTLKLEYLNEANELAKGQAHDALVDVLATVELARRFSKEEAMWNYLKDSFNKNIDRQRREKLTPLFQSRLESHDKALMVGVEFGSDNNYQSPVLSIGESRPYSNQTLWLRLDLPELRETTLETIDETTWVIRKRFGEPGILLPPLKRYWDRLSPERLQIVSDNIAWLQANPALFEEIIRHHQEFSYPEIPNLDIDAALYQRGFLSKAEQKVCDQFQVASPEERFELLDQFTDEETKILAVRILFRNFPEDAPEEYAEAFDQYMQQINPEEAFLAMLDYKGQQRTTPAGAMQEIYKLRSEPSLDDEQRTLLDELEEYIQMHF